jgi:CheY-like chemotaxis protein
LPHPIASTPACRLLLIDDEPLVTSALRRALGPGYQTLALSDARQALQLLARDEAFDAILCDLRMPGMDGLAFHAELTRRHPALARRVLFLSGASDLADGSCARAQLPEGRFLEKPFEVAQLRAAVHALVAGSEAPCAAGAAP